MSLEFQKCHLLLHHPLGKASHKARGAEIDWRNMDVCGRQELMSTIFGGYLPSLLKVIKL
jgi:hypothetical protein